MVCWSHDGWYLPRTTNRPYPCPKFEMVIVGLKRLVKRKEPTRRLNTTSGKSDMSEQFTVRSYFLTFGPFPAGSSTINCVCRIEMAMRKYPASGQHEPCPFSLTLKIAGSAFSCRHCVYQGSGILLHVSRRLSLKPPLIPFTSCHE